MADPDWRDLGAVEDLKAQPLQEVVLGKTRVAVSCVDGAFGAVSGVCNHVGGPLGQGALEGEYLVCPWHYWKFHRQTGLGEPGYETDRVPSYALKEEGGRLWVDLASATKRFKIRHLKHPLDRKLGREPGPLRVVGIATTGMDVAHPRYSTSDALLELALAHARTLGAETRLIALRDLAFRHCEGFYSRSARACTWPCSITLMDPQDQMDGVYEALVHWADVSIVSTPIRWGAASSLFYKMAERLNCVQNQATIRNRNLIVDKVTSFLITGGQDNIQGVAGQLMTFFSELGFHFPQFPFVGHSRGWTAEDMEENIRFVQVSEELHEGTRALVERAIALAERLMSSEAPAIPRGGRKASAHAGRPREESTEG